MKTDVLIIGGGPGGSAAAMFLLRQGITPLIIEQEEFPRFHIGESLTGESAQVLRRLGLEEEMKKREYPIKHGVKVYGTNATNSWYVKVSSRDDNWELYDNITWQVRRSDFDEMMQKEAVKRGAILKKGQAIQALKHEDGSMRGVLVRWPDGTTEEIEAKVTLDCSGQATFLANQKVTGPKYLGSYDKQVAFFSHVKGAIRDSGTEGENAKDNTLILYHNKFHWAWFIPVSDELTSVGVVFRTDYFKKAGMPKEQMMLHECRHMTPVLSERLPDLTPQEPIYAIPNFSYRVQNYTGKGFLCIGDSHRFIDPIFAYGVYFGIQEGEFAAEAIARHISGEVKSNGNPFADFERLCDEGQDVVEDVIGVLWEYPLAFQRIVTWRDKVDSLDLLAGRIYGEEGAKNPARIAMRRLMATKESERNEACAAKAMATAKRPELVSAG